MLNDRWQETLRHLEMGNFTALEEMLDASGGFDKQIIDWHKAGKFDDEPKALAETLTCACMLGRVKTMAYLLDNKVDLHAGTKTGLNGFHYAASSGRPDVIRLLIERGVSMEIENMYGGTVLGQALWSAVHEHKPTHAEIIELLLDAGATVEPGTTDWWCEQNVPDARTKQRVLDALARHGAK